MTVHVLIPTKNRKEITKQCVQSLSAQDYPDIRITIIDDGSTDGTREMLKKEFPDVNVIEGDGNLWWTGAMRKGIEYLLTIVKENDFVLIQNDDTYMEKNFISSLVKKSSSSNRMILGTAVKEYQTKDLLYNSHRIIRGAFRPTIVDTDKEIIETDTISGRGVLVPVEVFKNIGNFSTTFPHYAADYDFFCRAKKSAYQLGILSSVITYSTQNRPGLSKRLALKNKLNISELKELFFSRRSSSNLYSSSLLIALHVPFPQKLIGLLMICIFVIKFTFVNFLLNNFSYLFNHDEK